MAEIRYNPLLNDWTMVASNRQHRPTRPTGDCPFCPGSGKVPTTYEVYAYENDYPVLSPEPPEPDGVDGGPYRARSAYGRCEVLLYSSDHASALARLSPEHITQLVDLWADRFRALMADPNHRYILIFENRGAEVGATMPHPHGQIYAYPYIPSKIQRELDALRDYQAQNQRCLVCDMSREEQRFGGRMLAESRHFVSYVPYFSDYPFGAHIVSRTHLGSLLDLDVAQRQDLARMLKLVTAGLDQLYEKPMPYMMAVHQSPVNDTSYPDVSHFHIEFYPLLYAADKIKYLASSEVGAGAPANPAAVEQSAPLLRAAISHVRGPWGW